MAHPRGLLRVGYFYCEPLSVTVGRAYDLPGWTRSPGRSSELHAVGDWLVGAYGSLGGY